MVMKSATVSPIGIRCAAAALLILVAIPWSINIASAQTTSLSRDGEGVPQLKNFLVPNQQEGIAHESIVDPARYFVGPSDIIAVNIWMSPPLSFNLTVTPEGTLIIPTVGEIRVIDLTLEETKELVLTGARKKYLSAEITTTLVKPRPIIVMVTGTVLNPGLYTLTSIDRAHRAIEEANRPTRLQTNENVEKFLREMSTRNVVLKHRNGSMERIDIAKFLASKDDRWNPFLREGDMIIVPRMNKRKNVFGVYGEVNTPGRFEFVEGDSLTDALQIGQGFTRIALRDSVDISSLDEDGTHLRVLTVDAERILAGENENIPLQPGDRILVRSRKEMREDYRVRVEGEVLFPGYYPITKNQSRLSEVIRQAGGVTEFAALKAAVLYRRSVDPAEVITERLLSLRGGISAEDSADYYVETELRLRQERVNVDFARLMAGDSTQDVVVRDDDIITVPSNRGTIYVFGQLVSPGHVPYVPGQSVEYYVGMVGGFTDRARRDDVRVIKTGTKQWLLPTETVVEEGDYIWVPKEPDRPFSYYMTIASQTASVLAVILGIGVVITQISN